MTVPKPLLINTCCPVIISTVYCIDMCRTLSFCLILVILYIMLLSFGYYLSFVIWVIKIVLLWSKAALKVFVSIVAQSQRLIARVLGMRQYTLNLYTLLITININTPSVIKIIVILQRINIYSFL